jgi:hypothetical protein
MDVQDSQDFLVLDIYMLAQEGALHQLENNVYAQAVLGYLSK